MSYPGGQNPYDPYSDKPYGEQPYGQDPYGQPQYGQQPYGYPQQFAGYGGVPPEHPQATTIMILGIASLAGGLVCGVPLLAGPIAWVMGQKALKEIDASGGGVGGRSQVMIGFVCGILASIVLILVLLGLILIFAGVFALASFG